MRLPLWIGFLLFSALLHGAPAEAMLVVAADQHSAYEKLPQLVARVDALIAANPGVPVAILLDGDAFEYGNIVARRTDGALDFAALTALVQRGPVVLNLGNHEPDILGMADVVARLTRIGVRVISGNARNRSSGDPYAPASTKLRLGGRELTIVGVTTDALATFRVAIRPDLDLADPVVWAKGHFPELLRDAAVPVVMSHAGLRADRQMFGLAPAGTLFVGAHDHLRLIHREPNLVYVHSGSWLECVSVATLERQPSGLAWSVRQEFLAADDPGNPELAALVRQTLASALTAAETRVVGRSARALSPSAAATFAVDAARTAAKADAAVIGGTTFGAGMPAGEVTQYAFDAWVRFDGPLYVADVDGAALRRILARANQGPQTPFAERTGENLVAAGPGADEIVPGKTYRLVTSDWIARNPARYLGDSPPTLQEIPGLRLKPAVLSALAAIRTEPAHPAPEAAADAIDPEAAYALGKQLFDQLAPPEMKAQYEFPSPEQWNDFLPKLQAALQSGSLADLAPYAPQARAVLTALRTAGVDDDLSDWLEQRLDEVEGARDALVSKPPAPRPSAPPSPPKATPAPAPVRIPHYELWLARVRNRPVPARASEMMPVLRTAFAAEGVPPSLAWLAEAESSFNPTARSSAGAKGLFQLMPETARNLGLGTFLPDERTQPEKCARAAARYLRELRRKFGSWPLALAAYNAGEGRVTRSLESRKARDYATIASALPAETQMYVPKVCALVAVRSGTSITAL